MMHQQILVAIVNNNQNWVITYFGPEVNKNEAVGAWENYLVRVLLGVLTFSKLAAAFKNYVEKTYTTTNAR